MPTQSLQAAVAGATPVQAGTLARLLSPLTFFDGVGPEAYRSAGNAWLLSPANGAVLVEEGATSPFAWFLIKGSVQLNLEDGSQRMLAAGEADAGYPLANLRPAQYTVVCGAGCQVVQLELSFVRRLAGNPGPVRFPGGTRVGGGSWQNDAFAIEARRLQQAGDLRVPSMPGISARISQALQQDDFELGRVAQLISADPSIAGGLVAIANSTLFRGREAVTTIEGAVVRMGVTQTHTLVTTLATKSLFAAQSSWLRKRLQQIWRHAVDMAAYAAVLASFAPSLDTSRALLLGLLHEIGSVPLVELADRFPRLESTPGILDAVLANLGPELTERTLLGWGLDEFTTAACHQENWFYNHDGDIDYADVLVVAHLHGMIKARAYSDLPRLDETQAWQRMSRLGLSATTSVQVFEDARDQISQLRALLS